MTVAAGPDGGLKSTFGINVQSVHLCDRPPQTTAATCLTRGGGGAHPGAHAGAPHAATPHTTQRVMGCPIRPPKGTKGSAGRRVQSSGTGHGHRCVASTDTRGHTNTYIVRETNAPTPNGPGDGTEHRRARGFTAPAPPNKDRARKAVKTHVYPPSRCLTQDAADKQQTAGDWCSGPAATWVYQVIPLHQRAPSV